MHVRAAVAILELEEGRVERGQRRGHGRIIARAARAVIRRSAHDARGEVRRRGGGLPPMARVRGGGMLGGRGRTKAVCPAPCSKGGSSWQPLDKDPGRPSGRTDGGAVVARGERLTLLVSGVAPLLLAVAGLIVLEGPADRPELDQPPVMILSFFAEQDTVILGSFLLMLAAAVFLWFAGCLRAALRSAEGGEDA